MKHLVRCERREEFTLTEPAVVRVLAISEDTVLLEIDTTVPDETDPVAVAAAKAIAEGPS